MSNRWLVYGVVFVGLICIQASCKNNHLGGTVDCPKVKTEVLVAKLKFPLQQQFNFFSCKVDVEIQDSKSTNSFNAYVKMKPDSAFSGNVKVAGIIGAGYLVDRDTFAYKMRLKKCYKRESFSTLSDLFGTEVTYDFLQQLVLGQAVGIDQMEEVYPIKNDSFYVVANHEEHTMERLHTFNLSDEEMKEIYIQYQLECKGKELSKIQINVPKDAVSITISFIERQQVNDLSFPKETDVKIVTADDTVLIHLKYDDIELNDPSSIGLNIPDSYSECE